MSRVMQFCSTNLLDPPHRTAPLISTIHLTSSLSSIRFLQNSIKTNVCNFISFLIMVFLSRTRPSPKEQKDCISKSGTFNYDSKYRGASAKPLPIIEDKELSKEGFLINHSKTLVGSGSDAYEKGKTALQIWRHLGLNWAFVDPKRPIENGEKFCVCVKEFFPWFRLPLEVVYINETRNPKTNVASFGFGGGTLTGHLLCGEKRFSVEMDEEKQVWYEILSFSKPAHPLSFIGYPYVFLRQKYLAHQSSVAVSKFVSSK